MIATERSTERYTPMLLSNGRDAVLIDYGGSNVLSLNGHSHLHQNEGVSCGWYKVAHHAAQKGGYIQPAAIACLQVYFFGAPAEPRGFEQSFDPKTAILTTKLRFFGDIRIAVENFLTDGSIWCQSVKVENCPENIKLDIGFRVKEPASCIRSLALRLPYTFGCASASPKRHEFHYSVSDIAEGFGYMETSLPFDTCTDCEGIYTDVKTGFETERIMTCFDSSDGFIPERFENGFRYEELKKEHIAVWKAYFATSSVTLPDERIQYEYELSRYIIRASQNPESRMYNLGPLPNLWGGGTFCIYDAWYAHTAMLSCGNIPEAAGYMEKLIEICEKNKAENAKHGIPGTAFPGYTNIFGEYYGSDYRRSVMQEKTLFTTYPIINAAIYLRYQKNAVFSGMEEMILNILLFLQTVLVYKDGVLLGVKPMDSSTESGVVVEDDTMTLLSVGWAFRCAGKILNRQDFTEIGLRLFAIMKKNYRDGILMPFADAPYTGSLPLLYNLITLPDPVDVGSITGCLELGKTHVGCNMEQTTEEYLHWPWCDTHAITAYAHAKESHLSMKHMEHMLYGCASNGAFPEKIRLDGCPLNYWYTTPHALAVWAINDSFAYMDSEDEICLAYGFNEPWKDFSCRDIRLPNEFTVSYTVSDGVMTECVVKDLSSADRKVKINLNPAYRKSDSVQ